MNTSPVSSPLPTHKLLKSFHSIDRCLYKRLVIELHQDILLCMKAIAFWIWLEVVGFPHIVSGLLTIDASALSLIFEEAVCCMNCIESPLPPLFSLEGNILHIPLTKSMMSPMDINYTSLYKNRSSALIQITNTVNKVFVKAFDDIIQQVSPENPPPSVPTVPHVPNENKNGALVEIQPSMWQEGSSVIEDSSIWGNPSIWKY